ncbi:undecaprenyldiphospho-muramoylpentapeptide beta-N- acetylglucosaminyltransferase [Sulfitobacter sp. THAF37]|uniref:glycosyltransferase family protein n=1 Tax=Sulfitobacter sp. THAF37 TaxID=2587855 RepID=UPI00126791EA|nr:glycosyltransferase [Sulfitobacter sp. THAF37]QFT58796.1 undecaprenyldiphospho-muramoylpentapeptide beta-N- acetylglucosaminyltransferase [Sulfitobacter sp. THAF37]
MKVMIVVTHLLGTGHLSRALTLARAFRQGGHRVRVVSGGMPAPHLADPDLPLTQLPPVRSDGVDFTRLLDDRDAEVSGTFLAARQTALLSAFHDMTPDVVMTELFPFGRRILRAEFRALLDAARAAPQQPLICASIRDILAPPTNPKKAAFAEEIIAAYYDAVLVHADADITPLDLSWPVSPALEARLRYTGFVAPPTAPPHPERTGTGEIIVSAGGGDVGAEIFAAARTAAAADPDRTWRLLLGGANATARAAEMTGPPNMIVEPARPDFRQMLHHAAASVSMCGYNTALDLLQTGCPAVFIPFDAGSEVEQGLRAKALAQRRGFAVLRSAELTADALLDALAQITSGPRPTPLREGLDGAARTVEIVAALRRVRR